MNVFFHPDVSDVFTLSTEESSHAVRTLRLREKNKVKIIDGKGGLYLGEIINPDPAECSVKIIENQSPARPQAPALHVAIAPTKNIQRFEWFAEKATEIGIAEITPLICERSERKSINESRTRKILMAALKQSMNLLLPELHAPVKLSEFINSCHAPAAMQKFIAHYSDSSLRQHYTKGNPAIILIGPEGDFTEVELQLAKKNGFAEISLGNSRLRTETAGLVACSSFALLNL